MSIPQGYCATEPFNTSLTTSSAPEFPTTTSSPARGAGSHDFNGLRIPRSFGKEIRIFRPRVSVANKTIVEQNTTLRNMSSRHSPHLRVLPAERTVGNGDAMAAFLETGASQTADQVIEASSCCHIYLVDSSEISPAFQNFAQSGTNAWCAAKRWYEFASRLYA